MSPSAKDLRAGGLTCAHRAGVRTPGVDMNVSVGHRPVEP
jgi:hypothetical protein